MSEISKSYQVCRDEAMLLLQRGQLDRAVDLLQAVCDPGTHAWNDVGALQYERGMFDAATDCFRRAMDDPDAACNLAVALLDTGRKEEAVFRFQEVLAGQPGHARSHVLLGIETADPAARLEVRRLVPGQFVSVIRRVRFSGSDLLQEWQGRTHAVTDSAISLSFPRVRPILVPFREGSRVMAGMAADDAFWSACLEVEVPPSSEVPMLVLKSDGQFRKVQRREGVRVACPEIAAGARGTGSAVEVRLHDLSVTGAALIAPEKLPTGSLLRMRLPLGEEVFDLQGRVVRQDEAQKGSFLLGVAFLQVRTQVQDRIARFVNRVQFERRRGLR